MKISSSSDKWLLCFVFIMILFLPILCWGQSKPSEISAPAAIPINQIDASKIDQTVTVTGRIVNILPPTSDRAPYSFYINDGTETIRLVIWQDIYKQILGVSEYSIGKEIVARGTVKSFRSKLEIHLLGPKELRLKGEEPQIISEKPAVVTSEKATPAISAPPSAGITPISSITKNTIGMQVKVRGKVTNFRASWAERAPNIATIQDGTGIIDVVYWQDVAQNIPAAHKPEAGKTIEATGYVNEYQGRLQIRVSRADQIKVVAAEQISAVAEPPVSFKLEPILPATKQLPNKFVLIVGKINKVDERDQWLQLSISPLGVSVQALLNLMAGGQTVEKGLEDLILLKPKNDQLIIYVDKTSEMFIPEKPK